MKKRSFLFVSVLLMSLTIAGCNQTKPASSNALKSEASSQAPVSSEQPSSAPAQISSENKPSSQASSSKPVSSSVTQSKPQSSSVPTPSSVTPQPSSSVAQSSVTPTPSSSVEPSSSVVPEVTKYYVLYDNQEIAFEKVNDATILEGQAAEYKAVLGHVEKGKSIAILDNNKQPLTENFNAETGDNNVISEESGYVIHNKADNVFVLVKEWLSGWTNFYVSGYAETVYKVVGSMNQWRYEDSTIIFTDDTKPEEVARGDYVKQLKASFTVEKDDEFEVSDGDQGWITGRQLEANENFEVIDKGSGTGNIKALHNGDVDLYIKFSAEGSASLAIVFTKEAGIPQAAKVTLQVTKNAGFGNSIYLIGEFCEWNVASEKAVKFTWGEGNVWTAEWDIMTETTYECKLVTAASDSPTEVASWESGNNRSLLFTEAGSLTLTWQE